MASVYSMQPSLDAFGRLGTKLNSGEARDAVHLPVFPVKAACDLEPGQWVCIADNYTAMPYSSKYPQLHGVVDPFLSQNVQSGQRFWLFVNPRAITSLRHTWTIPGIIDDAEQMPSVIYADDCDSSTSTENASSASASKHSTNPHARAIERARYIKQKFTHLNRAPVPDERSVQTDTTALLGCILDANARPDVVHVALLPVKITRALTVCKRPIPMSVRGRDYHNTYRACVAAAEDTALGILDPFLLLHDHTLRDRSICNDAVTLKRGDVVWMWIYPHTVHKLTHVYTHPLFTPTKSVPFNDWPAQWLYTSVTTDSVELTTNDSEDVSSANANAVSHLIEEKQRSLNVSNLSDTSDSDNDSDSQSPIRMPRRPKHRYNSDIALMKLMWPSLQRPATLIYNDTDAQHATYPARHAITGWSYDSYEDYMRCGDGSDC